MTSGSISIDIVVIALIWWAANWAAPMPEHRSAMIGGEFVLKGLCMVWVMSELTSEGRRMSLGPRFFVLMKSAVPVGRSASGRMFDMEMCNGGLLYPITIPGD